MVRSVYFCGTPFHCITAIILSRQNNHAADIVVANNFENAGEVCHRLQKYNIFCNVFFIENYIKGKGLFFRAGITLSPYHAVHIGGMKGQIEGKYDYIYTNSIDNEYVNAIYYFNSTAEIILFEEGYASYLEEYLHPFRNFSFSHKTVRILSRILFKRKYIEQNISKILLYAPGLLGYQAVFPAEAIRTDKISDETMNDIRKVFAASENKHEYEYPYIFFEESYSNDLGDNSDLPIIDAIVSIAGKENLLIKLHPRDVINRFSSKGYHTGKSFGIPWEVMVLDADKVKCLITFSSASVLSYRLIFKKRIKTILLYKLDEGFARMSPAKRNFFEKYIKYYGNDFFLPENMAELKEYLKGVKEET